MTDDDVDFPPGDGPTSGISVTLTAGTLHATALQHPGRMTILTSDVEDIGLLTAEHPRLSAEKV